MSAPRKPFKILLPVLLLALVAGTIFLLKRHSDFLYAGTIEATKVDVPARVASVIGSFDVNEGDSVKAGQVLVRLSGEDLKIDADAAAEDYERAVKLYRLGSMPQETYEHLKSRRDEALLRWSWCNILSPLSGTVLNTYRENGEWVGPGTKLLTVADLNEVWAYVYVEEPRLARLSLGMKVSALIPEIPGRTFEGKVTKINDEAEFTPKNVQTRQERARLVFGIKITFENKDRTLKPGMSIEVKLP